MKLSRLKPRAAPFVSSRSLPTLSQMHDEKRLRGRALMERNQRLKQRDALCVECMKLGDEEARRQGFTVAVDEWDHIKPLWAGGEDHETNIQGLCLKHHAIKSEAERIQREQYGKLTIA